MNGLGLQMKNHNLIQNSLDNIKKILIQNYNVSEDTAYLLIKQRGIDKIFEKDHEIASHTSYKTWAKRAYEYNSQTIENYPKPVLFDSNKTTFISAKIPVDSAHYHLRKISASRPSFSRSSKKRKTRYFLSRKG